MSRTETAKTKSFWPEVLRVVASLAVVMIHVHSWDFKPLSPSDKSGFLLIDLFCYWSVPVFVMLSGGLLLRSAKIQPTGLILPPDMAQPVESPAVFFRKRWRRMIRPTLVWAALAVVWGLAAKGQGGEETLKRLATGVPNDPQWFLFMLLGLYALTPWLRVLLANPQFNRYWLVGLLADWSFGIYVIHPFVLTVLFKLFLRPIDGPFLPYCLVVWAATMLLSCLGCLVLRFKPVTAWIIP